MKTSLIHCHINNGTTPTDHQHTEWLERVEVLASFTLKKASFFVFRNQDGGLNVTHRRSGMSVGSVFTSSPASAFKVMRNIILWHWRTIQAATSLKSRGDLPVIDRTA